MARRESFKGNQKNRNKKISKEDRRLIYTKKKSKKEYNTKVIARDGLISLIDTRVDVTGRVKYINRKDSSKPVLLINVVIEGVQYDHIWVNFNKEDMKKLKFCRGWVNIHFTGVVYEYVKRNDRQLGIKYGLKDVELIKE